MLRVFLYAVMAVLAGQAQPILGPYSSSGNFAGDLYGSPDLRAGCWGFATLADTITVCLTGSGFEFGICARV
jgi:hypothetical protein